MRVARCLGLTITSARPDGSINFSGPTISFETEEMCSIPRSVRSMSVVPVDRPDLAHSVSPVAGYSRENRFSAGGMLTMSAKKDLGCAGCLVRHTARYLVINLSTDAENGVTVNSTTRW